MATLKAPFNFVPLNEQVVFPEWSSQVSHDVPFSDGISGSIEIKIEAKTPIFVRNGHIKEKNEDKETDAYQSFNKDPRGEYFIPATSIKGELRRIIEILSYCKMQQIDDKRYAMRDLQYRPYRDSFVYEKVHCGWMYFKDNGEIEVTDNGIPYRISHSTLDEKFNSQFCELFAEGKTIKEENKTAEYKYKHCPKAANQLFSFTKYKLYPNSNEVDKRTGVRFSKEGEVKGRIVLTGQPGPRKERKGSVKASGKFFEFVFEEKENPLKYTFTDEDSIIKDFLFIYKESKDWKYWKKEAKNNRIPVFFIVENNIIQSIGLSYLYKLPFKKRIREFVGKDHNSKELDMSECIFGTTGYDSLKGRVQISHAYCEKVKPFSQDIIRPYLGSPKPTYYPIYLEQQGKDGYIDKEFVTMMSPNAMLRGWKIYPVRGDFETLFPVDDNQKENTNPSRPLGAESKFKFNINFHNLKPVELGAVLYAIALRKGCLHSLGFAKAFGYGACEYSILSVKGFKSEDIDTFIGTFCKYMEEKVLDYKKSTRIRELFLMLNPDNAENLKIKLEYMKLQDFVSCKRHNPRRDINGEYLRAYSDLIRPQERTVVSKETEAIVTFFSGALKQARLAEGKDSKKRILDMNCKKDKLKVGDRIIVNIIDNGKKLRFIKKK